ncbi:Uncharacterised protein [Mycobacteroides abscessus subsp. abscessus]|nr:Uncharacterised protein [Mycobacteroides abscessus subsp. abscessus]
MIVIAMIRDMLNPIVKNRSLRFLPIELGMIVIIFVMIIMFSANIVDLWMSSDFTLVF